MRIGIAWRVDDAEPGILLLSYVLPDSPAAKAGLAIGDRIYRVAGRNFADEEATAGKAVCVIGDTVKKQLFAGVSPLGEDLRVKNFTCQIIGVLKAKGQGAMGNDQDDVVLLAVQRDVAFAAGGAVRIARVGLRLAGGAPTQAG